MKFIFSSICLLLCLTMVSSQNKYDNTWVLGIDFTNLSVNGYEDKAEGSIMNFNTSPPNIIAHPIPYKMTSACSISDPTTGDLLFYTNGCSIINKLHQVMENGDDINRSDNFYRYYCEQGPSSYQGNFYGIMALPHPDSSHLFYVLHHPNFLSGEPYYRSIWYTIVDVSANEGLGKVLSKNNKIIDKQDLAYGYFTACKGADPKSWWILAWQHDSPTCIVLRLDSQGLRYSHKQTIGDKGPYAIGQAVFSPDGKTYMWYDLANGVHVYDFDREKGILSRHRTIPPINEYYIYGIGGVTISPNSQYAYLSARHHLYQLDLKAEPLSSGLTFLDTTYYLTPYGVRLNFSASILAPDCRVYISTGFAYYHMHVIHDPDQKGTACNLEKMAITLPFPNDNSVVPNMPHYRMDQVPFCNPSIPTAINDPDDTNQYSTVSPNPFSAEIMIQTPTSSHVSIYSLTGDIVMTISNIEAGQHTIHLGALSEGMYLLRVQYRDGTTESHKIIKL
jgi:hypothetical protein